MFKNLQILIITTLAFTGTVIASDNGALDSATSSTPQGIEPPQDTSETAQPQDTSDNDDSNSSTSSTPQGIEPPQETAQPQDTSETEQPQDTSDTTVISLARAAEINPTAKSVGLTQAELKALPKAKRQALMKARK